MRGMTQPSSSPPSPPLSGERAYCITLLWCFHVLLLSLPFFITAAAAAASQSIVESLPGFPGALPFKLETGYVSVGELDEVHLFYYFIESERDAEHDPLVIWIPGGPGCSAFSVLVYEIGPLKFDASAFNGSFPRLFLNPFSWTKVANVIFLDAPAGTGFSYSKNSEAYHSSDTKFVKDVYNFIQNWLISHPKFQKNPLYIGGGSYTGKTAPMVALEISNGNEAGNMPYISLQGYMLSNPLSTDIRSVQNSRIWYAHRMGFISDEYYEATRNSCKNEYANVDPNNTQCIEHLRHIQQVTSRINMYHILEPSCSPDDPKPEDFRCDDRSSGYTGMNIALPSREGTSWCRFKDYVLPYIWANDPSVQEALQVRKGTIIEWKRCNRSLSLVRDVPAVFDHHLLLINKGYQALIWSGDHDMGVPYIGTLSWIKDLNLSIADYWRPWFVDDQIAGFTEKYKRNEYHLTFATVKGAGHTPGEYKPKECLAMVDRWFSNIGL